MTDWKAAGVAFVATLALLGTTGASQAVVYCKTVGYPKGCVARPVVVAPVVVAPAPVVVAPRAVVVAPAPRVYATPRVGVGAGVGVGVNRGGPVNRVGVR